jgi:hypothetical protein
MLERDDLILKMLKKCDDEYLDNREIFNKINNISLIQLKMNMSNKKINIENKQLIFDSTFFTEKSYEFLYSLFLYIQYSLSSDIYVNESNNSARINDILYQFPDKIKNHGELKKILKIDENLGYIIFETNDQYNARLEYINKLFTTNIIFLQEFNTYKKDKFPKYNFYYHQESQKAAVIGIDKNFEKTVVIEKIKYKNLGVCHSENIKERLFNSSNDKQIFDLIYNLCGENLELFNILKINEIYYVSLQGTKFEYYDSVDKINQLFISIKNLPIQFIISGDLNISHDLFKDCILEHKSTNYPNIRIESNTINVIDFNKYLEKYKIDKDMFPLIKLIESLEIQFKTPQPTVYAMIHNIEDTPTVPSFFYPHKK